ncbi:hypothetical protein [Streptomyces natalensis]|uniref:Uncharacterized protein n=1 Tax=Streptomyces natalensis ATCC 27448 TaxID=1240678 RepID=A0A0D7CI38_9ACTN|nr:hypothetical protein [Streptomyces natalensis]KIZ15696.1 hypothetical protein SNA_25535 [Streptomyces natalensis ATCC 27448]
MIVRCTQIISPATGEVVPDHPSIRVGAEYPVLEVLTTANRVQLRIPELLDTMEHRDSPGLWDASMFTVVSSRMPSCWVAELEDGRLTLAPREWQRTGFWEDYFDVVPAAVDEYDRLRAEILAEL